MKYSILPLDNCKKLYYYDEKLHEKADLQSISTFDGWGFDVIGELGFCSVERGILHN